MNFDSIDLTKLSTRERVRLRERIDHSLVAEHHGYTADELAVHDALSHALQRNFSLNGLVYDGMPDPIHGRKPFGRKKYSECCAEVMGYINKGAGALIRRPQRNEITKLVFQCLRESLPDHRAPTPHALLDQIPYIDWAVDLQFPGYTAAGMLHHLAAVEC